MNVSKQYLVPKDGTPLQGLIQDHVIAGESIAVNLLKPLNGLVEMQDLCHIKQVIFMTW